MHILGLLGVYFDTDVVVFVTKFSLLFRLALAILCNRVVQIMYCPSQTEKLMAATNFSE